MRFPFISRSTHDEIVRDLKNRISELDFERKKLHDEVRIAGGFAPMFFPRTTDQPEKEPSKEEAEKQLWDINELVEQSRMQFKARLRPSSLGPAMAQKIDETRTQPPINPDIQAEFDRVQQAAGKANGHASA